MKPRKLIIMGSGPAGLTAAIYAARANIYPLVIEGSQAGGQLTITTDVENFPGFPLGIQGPELMNRFRQQAERFGTQFLTGDLTAVNVCCRPFRLELGRERLVTHALIVASGASARFLGLPSEARLMGRGVSACATCDGFFFKDKEVAVVGGGDTAMEEAIYLTRYAKSVCVIHRRDELRASPYMAEQARQNEKISFVWDTVVDEVLDDGTNLVTGVMLKNVKTGDLKRLDCQGLFMGIGHNPNTDVFQDQLELNPQGYIITRGRSTATSMEGVFACGDVQDPIYRQAVTAAGTGCMAALDAERYLARINED